MTTSSLDPDELAQLGVSLTNLDDPLFDGAGATKRDLIAYLDGVAGRIIPVLVDRPLSVIRVHRGQEAFMQKNLPTYTPAWVPRVTMWAESSKREVTYALCNDRRTLLWFGNQRAVEYHPSLIRVDNPDHMTHLILDIDPPNGDAFVEAVRAARVVRQVLTDAGLEAVIKTSGAKGLHIFVPIDDSVSIEAAAAATRAIAARAEVLDPDTVTSAFMKEDRGGKVFVDSTRVGGATVAAAYSPRVRPGAPVSFPVEWDDLDNVSPADFTVLTALRHLGDGDRWAARMPQPQQLSAELVEEGRAIPVARVQAMHEAESADPPAHCAICDDERQYVGPDGQRWTTLDEMRGRFHNTLVELEPGLVRIVTEPEFAIGQYAFLVCTPFGNVLWDCLSHLDEETVTAVRSLGGIDAIAISHPHFYASCVEWSHAFNDAPIFLSAADSAHVMRPGPAIVSFTGDEVEPIPGVRVLRLGGHFHGAAALLWPAGAEGRGVLLTGDTIALVAAPGWVTYMYSYPNRIPLPGNTVRELADRVLQHDFDRIYPSAPVRPDNLVPEGAKEAVRRSAERYIGMVEGAWPRS
jgi:bifunctional non-homologous end joining protein LigD